ncbi:MAG: EscU/YscU/HrcU family type III secretion system export apparatus switch protein [Pseudomonadota bacterium]
MAQQEHDKTEQATPQKLREARKKGQVSKSQEINSLLITAGFFVGLLLFWPSVSAEGLALVRRVIRLGIRTDASPERAQQMFESIAVQSFTVVLPLLLVIVVMALLANILQTRFVFSTHPLKPDFTRLNPAQGFKKLFSRKALFDLFKSLLRLILLLVLVLVVGRAILLWLSSGATLGLQSPGDFLVGLLIQSMLLLLLVMSPIVFLDWIFTRYYFAHQMKMSRREVREELKRYEGAPEIRSKRKELQNALRQKSGSLRLVKDADVIITNPVHVAVALRYVRGESVAPVIVAAGGGELAAKIKKLGRKYRKPILRRPPLARALSDHGEVGRSIPVAYYAGVADVYRWLYQQKEMDSAD